MIKLRERIAENCEKNSELEEGEIELDGSHFGTKRVRGERGCRAKSKTPVFGILKRDEKV